MHFHNINEKKMIIIGVSGGPDSVYLLHQLFLHGFLNVCVCHVNYQKRANALVEANYVIDLAKKYHFLCASLTVDKQMYADYYKINHNFQTIARQIRYDFFAKQAVSHQGNTIMVAHTLNDHIESYLIQQQRQIITDHYGLKAENVYFYKQTAYQVLRPLITISKTMILQYLAQEKIRYYCDESNFQPLYLRNRIRQKLGSKEIQYYAKLIEQKNNYLKHKLSALKQIIKQEKIIEVLPFLRLQPAERQMIIYYFLQRHGLEAVCAKKSKILFEITKQMSSAKKHVTFMLNQHQMIMKKDGRIRLINIS